MSIFARGKTTNRVVWNVLYHETFPELQYGFTEQIRDTIRQQLESAVNPEKISKLFLLLKL